MKFAWSSLVIISTVCILSQCEIVSKKRTKARSSEYRIKRIIMQDYDKTTRPVVNDKSSLDVHVSISLYHILDTKWKDEYLTWNASEFGDVTAIRVPASSIWTPDIVISNYAGDNFNNYMVTNAIVNSDGSVLWLYLALVKTYCKLNVKYFPFDTQRCNVTFVSWTHSMNQLDVIYNHTTFPVASYYNDANQEWRVDNITAVRTPVKYACCDELYPDVTFTIHLRRGSLFYVLNLIFPCLLIFTISFLGFFLPVESGEKVSLETTILLALVVFLLTVTETMPPTPDAMPILGMFFGGTMLMVSVALVMAVVVTNIYAKKNSKSWCWPWLVNMAARWCLVEYTASFISDSDDTPIRRQSTDGANGSLGSEPGAPSSWQRGSGSLYPSAANNRKSSPEERFCAYCEKYRDRQLELQNDMQPSIQVTYHESLPLSQSKPRHHHHHHQPEDEEADHAASGERREAEWRMVAYFVDRVFFWVFLVMTTVVQATIFVNMVPAS